MCYGILLGLQIREVALVTDKATQKRRGFVFVEFTTDEAADKATVETFHTIDDVQVCYNDTP